MASTNTSTPVGPPDGKAERRAYRRAGLERPVMLETRSKTTTARGVDVSGGGLSLRTECPVAVGERVSVYFELPIGYGVEAEAEVLRCEGTLVALRFVEATHEAILAVRSYCRISGLMPAAGRSPTP